MSEPRVAGRVILLILVALVLSAIVLVSAVRLLPPPPGRAPDSKPLPVLHAKDRIAWRYCSRWPPPCWES